MFRRTAAILFILSSSIIVSGCPGAVQVLPGKWTFTFYNEDGAAVLSDRLVELAEDGSAAALPNARAELIGVDAWWQSGQTFTLQQEAFGTRTWHTAKVSSETYLQGDTMDPDTHEHFGTFEAYRSENQ